MVDRAVILAGGKSSRMGRDKALLPFGEYNSLAEFQYERLKTIFDEVYISAKYDKFDFNPELIIDKKDALFSPILAIKSTLEELNSAVFVLGVDMPILSLKTVLKILKSFNDSFDAVVAESGGFLEPLCGVYTPSILRNIERLMRENHHRLVICLIGQKF